MPASPSLVLLRALLLVALAACLGCDGPRRAAAPAPMPITAAELRKITSDPSRPVVLVNVWATWCEPCKEELPALVKLRHEYAAQGLELILVSADFDRTTEDLVKFLAANGIDFPTYLKTERDADFIGAIDPDWSGAIPVSFLHVKGESVDFWEGAATYDAFARKVTQALAMAREGS